MMLEFIQNTDFALDIIRTEDRENAWAISTVSHAILLTNQEDTFPPRNTQVAHKTNWNDSLVIDSLFTVVYS